MWSTKKMASTLKYSLINPKSMSFPIGIFPEVFMSDETIEKTFQVAAPARLIISNVRGSVTIQPGEANVIEVKAVKHGNFDNDRNTVEMTQDADGSVRVETRSNEALFGFLSHPPKVDYIVRVPQGIHLDASCVSSSLMVSDLEGVFQIKDHQRRYRLWQSYPVHSSSVR